MRRFRELGDDLAARWAAADYDERAFPALATAALEAARLHEGFTPYDALRLLLLGDAAGPLTVEQSDGAFGEPPVAVYRGRGFYIEVLHWLDATTSIHSHAFSGAFQVLAGASIHAAYRFEREERVRSTLYLGRAEAERVELLRRGAVRPILGGDTFIHALFHLERPSVSLIVRTTSEHDHLPQWTVLPPSIAYDAFEPDRLRDRRLQALTLLARCDAPALDAIVSELAATADFPALFHTLRHLATPHLDPATLARWLALARPRHGARIDRLAPALAEHVRRAHITERRHAVTDPGLRYFLALLLNVPTRADVLRLVADAGPPDPIAAVRAWVAALATHHDTTTTSVLDITLTHPPELAERLVAMVVEVVAARLADHDADQTVAHVAAALGPLDASDEHGIRGLHAGLGQATSPFVVLTR